MAEVLSTYHAQGRACGLLAVADRLHEAGGRTEMATMIERWPAIRPGAR